MKRWQGFLPSFFSFGGAIFLGIEVYFRLFKNKSLCTTESCAIVGDYVRIGEINLIILGLIFLSILGFLLFFYNIFKDKNKWIIYFLYLLFGVGIAADSVLFGFQIVLLKEFCQICFIFAGVLLLSLLAFGLSQKKYLFLISSISVYLVVIGSFFLLDLPKKQVDLPPTLQDLKSIYWAKKDAPAFPKAYLFMSFHCEHCSKVLANLAVNSKAANMRWHIFPLDSKEADLKKLYYLLNSKDTLANPFLEILKVESGEVDISQQKVEPKLLEQVRDTQKYFINQGFQGVPVLILEEGPGKKVILTGSNTIIEYLKEKGFLEKILNFLN